MPKHHLHGHHRRGKMRSDFIHPSGLTMARVGPHAASILQSSCIFWAVTVAPAQGWVLWVHFLYDAHIILVLSPLVDEKTEPQKDATSRLDAGLSDF